MPKFMGRYFAKQLILKITLAGSDPKIWRRVEVHSGLTLDGLHEVIQLLFDWDGSHMYQFLAPQGGKLTRRALTDAIRYHTLPPDPFFGDDDDDASRADETLVGQVLNTERKQIVYEYDFGDSWTHIVKVEKRTPGGDQGFIPVCLGGENAGPGDDKGGMGGYYYWLEALRDENHESHEEAVNWFGEDFDPAKFDMELVNKQLGKAFAPVKKKARKPKKRQK